MTELVACVPKFSEGRDETVVDELVAALESVAGVEVLDRHSAYSHHRSVITAVGSPEVLLEGVLRVAEVAARRIDLTRHQGTHPRMGATDVVSFSPVSGTTMDRCVQLAETCGERIGTELDIPVFLYGSAARCTERRSLAHLRRGQFEQLAEVIGSDPELVPDFGPARVHPTAGATAVGAHALLVAFNLVLGTPDVDLAERIAEAIRERDGGLPAVRALGFHLQRRDLAQVSVFLLDHQETGIETVFEEVERRAREAGSDVLETELVGLAPSASLQGDVPERIRLVRFDPARHVLERRAGLI